tara:strand:- start:340 stop:1668 length:1329 start_codon:yes stop_codon:yes gene_type:complete
MDGTRLEVHGTLGRVVVATRSFAPGEVVMAEQPLIVFDASPGASPESYLQAFASATSLVQASVLDMFHPPLDKDTPVVVARRRVANGLDGIFGLSKELIHKLLLIRDTNCHSYTGHEVAYSEVMGGAFGGVPGNSTKAALFDLGSKVAHSCCPNVSYTSKSRHGGLVYLAIRPISADEIVTYSYIDNTWTSTTRERQATCLEVKDFLCHCTRCAGLDTSCAIFCPTKSCAGFANPKSLTQPLQQWTCTVCGPLDESGLRTVKQQESSLQQELEELDKLARLGGAIHPNNARSIAERAAKTLSPAHRLVARAYDVVVTLCASHAAAAQRAGSRQGNYGSQVELRMQAVEAAEKHVKVCECIAAGCHGGIICTISHPAVFECANTVFFAAQDLMQQLPRQRSSGALAFVARYVGHMRTMHGEADTDVVAVQQMVQGAGGEHTLY